MNKQEKCIAMVEHYGWKLEDLLKHNDSQVDSLYNACLNEDGQLRKKPDELVE